MKDTTMNKKKTTTPKSVANTTKFAKKKKSSTQTKIVIDEKIETITAKPIEYSKFNPKITSFSANKWWNIFKYGLAISLVIFCILGLYFASVWQAKSNGAAPATGTLMQIKMMDSKSWSFMEGLKGVATAEQITLLDGLASLVKTQSLFELVPFFTTGMLTSLMVFSIIGVLWIIPLLVFKNQTKWSLYSLIIGVVFLVLVIVMFSIGMHAQNTLLAPYKEIDSISKQITSYKKSGNAEYNDRIVELQNKFNLAIGKFVLAFI